MVVEETRRRTKSHHNWEYSNVCDQVSVIFVQ